MIMQDVAVLVFGIDKDGLIFQEPLQERKLVEIIVLELDLNGLDLNTLKLLKELYPFIANVVIMT